MKTNNTLTSPQRERTSVAIQGLDLSTPDDTVKDGSCSELHNLRYKDNAWRPVHPHKSKSVTLTDDSGNKFTILYKHPADLEDVYIARRVPQKGGVNCIICRFDTSTRKYTDIISLKVLPKISHFGNVLILTSDNSSMYYLYAEGKYTSVNNQMPIPTSIITSRTTFSKTTPNSNENNAYFVFDTPFSAPGSITYYKDTAYPYSHISDILSILNTFNAVDSNRKITLYQRICHIDEDILTDTYKKDDETGKTLIYGNMCYVIAYRGTDGRILQVSPIQLITRSKAFSSTTKLCVGELSNFAKLAAGTDDSGISLWFTTEIELKKDTAYATNLASIEDSVNCPFIHEDAKISFSIPSEAINDPLFASVAIYCSLPTPIYPTVNLKEQYTGPKVLSFQEAYNTKGLFDQPLYLLDEISKKDIPTSRTISLQLTQYILESMIGKSTYTPVDYAQLSGGVMYDYNLRLHLGNVSKNYLSYPHIQVLNTGGQSSVQKTKRLGVAVDVNGSTKYIMPASFSQLYDIKNKYIISIPDTSIKAFLSNIQNLPIAVYPFSHAYGIGFAFYTRPSTAEYQFPTIGNLDDDGTISNSQAVQEVVSQTNRIQVSDVNNCFSFPYENSYRVGSDNNKIIAMQSAAIKIGDEQVGALPLYVFTEEGIFALRAGESTLYAAVNPINYDKVINPSTLAINGAVAYITEQGVHLLTGEGSKVISTPIHNANGMPDLNFLKTCVFLHSKQFNEIVLLDGREADTKTHYVFNLDHGYWSTRELNGTKINTDELVDNTNGIIYDLNDEDESNSLSVEITTRPIKLGNVEFKRLETIIPRMATNDHIAIVNMDVQGSIVGTNYAPLRSIENMEIDPKQLNPITLRRTPFSAKYFKYHMTMEPETGEPFNPSITHIDFEWYTRYVRRMR